MGEFKRKLKIVWKIIFKYIYIYMEENLKKTRELNFCQNCNIYMLEGLENYCLLIKNGNGCVGITLPKTL